MCFVNCHLAVHLDAVNRRNADFNHIYRNITFGRSIKKTSVGVSLTAQMLRPATPVAIYPDEGKPDLAKADMVIFYGNFNYRIFGITYDDARDFISQRSYDWLRQKDQLRAEMKARRVFQGMREALIRFHPLNCRNKGRDEVYIRASAKGQPFTIREVMASNIGQLVKISGIVTRCSDVKAEILRRLSYIYMANL